MSTTMEQVSVGKNMSTKAASCRFCGAGLSHTFTDLGMSPPCESNLSADQLNQMEAFYPLHVYVCEDCFLVQLEEYVSSGKHLHRVRLLLLLLRQLAGPLQGLHRPDGQALRARPRQPGGGAGQQRRLPAAVFRGEGRPGAGH